MNNILSFPTKKRFLLFYAKTEEPIEIIDDEEKCLASVLLLNMLAIREEEKVACKAFFVSKTT